MKLQGINGPVVEIPDILYKYRDWSDPYHKKILTDFELFMPSPKRFNDPFDCKMPVAYWLLQDDPKYAKEYVRIMVKRTMGTNWTEEQIEKAIDYKLKEGRHLDSIWQEEIYQRELKGLYDNFGVLSLTENVGSLPMWAYYSANHSGFCVGFNTDSLCFSNGRRFMGGPVLYHKELPNVLPTMGYMEQSYLQLYSKLDSWSHEGEYRLTTIGQTDQVLNLTKEDFAVVYIGSRAGKATIEEILNTVTVNMPGVPVYQWIEPKKGYKMERKQLL